MYPRVTKDKAVSYPIPVLEPVTIAILGEIVRVEELLCILVEAEEEGVKRARSALDLNVEMVIC